MEFEATLVELDRIMRALSQENAALRALLTDYEALVSNVLDVSTAIDDYLAWHDIRAELKARYDALMKGGKS